MSRSRGHVAGLEMHLGDAVVVAAQEADQDLGVDPAGIGVDPAHDAEVERDERAVRPELEVALVHVGVEEAVAQRVGQEGLDDPLGEPHRGRRRWPAAPARSPRLMPSTHSSVSTRRPEAGQITAGTRKPGSRAVLAANSAAAAASIRRSSSPWTTPSKCADHRLRPQPAGEGREELDHAGGEVEGVDVAQEGALDAGAQHLDRDHLAGLAQRGAVDLGERGGGDRRLEVGEDRVDRLAELALDRGARLRHREGRQLVLQHGELGRELRADHVGPGGEELAELDVGGAERGQRAQDRRLGRVALVARATGTASRARARRRAAPAARRRPRARSASRRCARRWRRCGSAARGCAGRASPQSFQAECSAAMPIERLR